ncbi:hypothetical protein [Streptomyces sp. NPDC050504]|uniref:hypothetical protein n=1 Tax=Streptomyces sp. NPDC050504 TaxID=3365618 RepID=UPI00379BEE3B
MKRSAIRTNRAVPVALAAMAVVGGLAVAPAHAAPPPPTGNCNPTVDTMYYDVTTKVTPVITDFLAVTIAEGTTGQRTESLTQLDSVTTTVDRETEIKASAAALFAKVEARVRFSVSKTTSSTRTHQITNTWNFNRAGQYALYRGTRKVEGEYVKYVCAQTGPTTGVWVNAIRDAPHGTFTTFEAPEIGTAVRNCAALEPLGTVRRAAQDRLGAC